MAEVGQGCASRLNRGWTGTWKPSCARRSPRLACHEPCRSSRKWKRPSPGTERCGPFPRATSFCWFGIGRRNSDSADPIIVSRVSHLTITGVIPETCGLSALIARLAHRRAARCPRRVPASERLKTANWALGSAVLRTGVLGASTIEGIRYALVSVTARWMVVRLSFAARSYADRPAQRAFCCFVARGARWPWPRDR